MVFSFGPQQPRRVDPYTPRASARHPLSNPLNKTSRARPHMESSSFALEKARCEGPSFTADRLQPFPRARALFSLPRGRVRDTIFRPETNASPRKKIVTVSSWPAPPPHKTISAAAYAAPIPSASLYGALAVCGDPLNSLDDKLKTPAKYIPTTRLRTPPGPVPVYPLFHSVSKILSYIVRSARRPLRKAAVPHPSTRAQFHTNVALGSQLFLTDV